MNGGEGPNPKINWKKQVPGLGDGLDSCEKE